MPVRVIAPLPPGGTTDLIARIVQAESDKLGKLVRDNEIVAA